MKFIVLIAVVIAVMWLARSLRRRGRASNAPGTPPPAREAMIACSQCGVHLPRSEALPGRGGVFCSEAHRAAFERAERTD